MLATKLFIKLSVQGTAGPLSVRRPLRLLRYLRRSHHVGHKALECRGLHGSREVQVVICHPLVELAALEDLGPLQRGMGSVLLRLLRISVVGQVACKVLACLLAVPMAMHRYYC